MIIELKKDDLRTFAHLVYMGNIMANGNRRPDETLKTYEQLTDYCLAKIYNVTQTDKDFSEDDFRESISDEVINMITDYERGSIPETLAKMLAERDFPFTDYNSDEAERHFETEGKYEEELTKNGVKNLFLRNAQE